jgi:hypothetical protein
MPNKYHDSEGKFGSEGSASSNAPFQQVSVTWVGAGKYFYNVEIDDEMLKYN